MKAEITLTTDQGAPDDSINQVHHVIRMGCADVAPLHESISDIIMSSNQYFFSINHIISLNISHSISNTRFTKLQRTIRYR